MGHMVPIARMDHMVPMGPMVPRVPMGPMGLVGPMVTLGPMGPMIPRVPMGPMGPMAAWAPMAPLRSRGSKEVRGFETLLIHTDQNIAQTLMHVTYTQNFDFKHVSGSPPLRARPQHIV